MSRDTEICSVLPGEWDCFSSSFSGGLLLEVFNQETPGSAASAAQTCDSYILIPAENTWPSVLRAVVYFIALLYCFIGFAAITACFMAAMETIVQQTRVKKKWDPVKRRKFLQRERVWNPVIADITLLAMGTCAPQIALAMIDGIQLLGKDQSEGLGPGTIVGGAAFNVFPILASIVLVPKPGTSKRIENYGVFVVETMWSFWAYLWVLIIVQWVTPSQVTLWEAILTVLQMPILMFHAYGTDRGWFRVPFMKRIAKEDTPEGEEGRVEAGEGFPVRILPRISSSTQLYHKWRSSYSKYRVQATTAVTAERRPNASEATESIARKLRRKLLSGLTLSTLALRRTGVGRREEEDMKKEEEEQEEERRRKAVEFHDFVVSSSITNVDSDGDDDLSSVEEEEDREEDEVEIVVPLTWKHIFRMWKQQLIDAMSVKGSVDEFGRERLPGVVDFIMHPITFVWKTLFAIIIPPPPLCGGWVPFLAAIFCITGIAAFVIEVANLFGCVSGADSFVVALTILASGTSFPDLIASYIAADHESTADSAVANINASNCITVFLGLGLPWLMSVLYNKINSGSDFQAPSGSLAFTLFTYFGTFAMAIGLLSFRRRFLGGELGGRRLWAYLSSFFFIFLWFFFLLLSSLKAYSYV